VGSAASSTIVDPRLNAPISWPRRTGIGWASFTRAGDPRRPVTTPAKLRLIRPTLAAPTSTMASGPSSLSILTATRSFTVKSASTWRTASALTG
jgi:hypothetical protein